MEVRSKSGPRPAFSLLVVFALALSACTIPLHVPMEQDPARAAPGMLASIESAGGYPDLVLRALIWWQGLSEQVPTQYGVSLYRVSYWTTGPDGRLTIASGLVALPRADSLLGVVSYQHGTASQRKSAPVSGPYDLAAISIPHALEGRSWASSL